MSQQKEDSLQSLDGIGLFLIMLPEAVPVLQLAQLYFREFLVFYLLQDEFDQTTPVDVVIVCLVC